MKTLVIYYSYTGNTDGIVQLIKQQINADAVRIETAKPYEGSYNSVVEQGHREVNSGFMPELKSLTIDLDKYDNVILASPVWWYTFAPAMKSFLAQTDFKGKKIYPLATNGGWLGHTFEDYTKQCQNGNVQQGLNLEFNGNKLRTNKTEIIKWLKTIK